MSRVAESPARFDRQYGARLDADTDLQTIRALMRQMPRDRAQRTDEQQARYMALSTLKAARMDLAMFGELDNVTAADVHAAEMALAC